MAEKRPASLLVIAILGIIVGLNWTCCNGLGTLSQFPWMQDPKEAAESGPESESTTLFGQPWLHVVDWLLYLFNLIVSISLIVMGIALLRLRKWARALAIVCGWAVVLASLCGIPMTIWEWTTEPAELQDIFGIEPQQMVAFVHPFYLGLLLTLAVWLVYGISLLIVIRRPALRDALRGQSRPVCSGA